MCVCVCVSEGVDVEGQVYLSTGSRQTKNE
jgi:hypothetical protein